MNPVVTPEIAEVMSATHYQPAVSVFMPFEPKVNLKTELLHTLKLITDKVERALTKDYSKELSAIVMKKWKKITTELNFESNKKSIAIYVSPVFEKVLYLDIPMEEKIMLGETFEIRDLVYSKKQLFKYLLLIMSSKESRILLGNPDGFVNIASATAESFNEYYNESQDRVANFSDASGHKEILLEKFLYHIDGSLDTILNTYHLPLFVLGTERIIGHFKQITKHNNAVIEFMHGNYLEATVPELQEIIKPLIADWNKLKQKDLLSQIERAADKNKLAIGIKEVWHEAANLKGKLLIVEKDFTYTAQNGSNEDMIYQAVEPYDKFSCIKDAVDHIIQKVLENGGDVEFVDKDFLKVYHQIVLIKFY